MTNEDFLRSISLDGEEWRDVVGYEGLYSVSNLGRVASLNRVVVTSNKHTRVYKAKLLSPIMRNPYLSVILCGNNRHRQVSIHRLVAASFLPNPNGYNCVDHLDTDKQNNKATNLRWCTTLGNLLNPISKTKHDNSVAKREIPCNYKRVQCLLNGRVIKTYNAIKFAAQDGFNPKSISQVLRGNKKTHKGYVWIYAPNESSNQ